eukprot:6114698-Pleurochrysis_carterae.AAC.1
MCIRDRGSTSAGGGSHDAQRNVTESESVSNTETETETETRRRELQQVWHEEDTELHLAPTKAAG